MAENNRFRSLRKRLGSQLALSVAAGVSPAMIVAIECYGYLPGPEVRARLAKALGVSEAMLWSGLEKAEARVLKISESELFPAE